MFDVVGFGGTVLDTLVVVKRFPEEDVKAGPAERVLKQGGGLVATGICATGKLGGSCTILAAVADDGDGRFLKNQFNEYGVNTDYVVTRPNSESATCVCIINQENGSRTIIGSSNVDKIAPPIRFDELPLDIIKNAKVLHVGGNPQPDLIKVLDFARENGVKVLLDIEMPNDLTEDVLARSNFIITSKRFLPAYTKTDDTKASLKMVFDKFHPDIVVTTLGNAGGMYYDGKEYGTYPIFPAEVIDTTGCGDVFHGAFAYGYVQGWSWSKICHFSSAVSSMKCMKLGGRSGIPTLPELIEYITPYYDLDAHE